ncbi:cytochrome P450 4V2 [Caerostris extrusa]|uniref:Cytochrome P450 4V2 n=1 Tax=Caerostris extrusa TaxID=172846 RepID=A0AAV4NZG5_CAEEX|nr:cytochrome P450 4V2 [Caerostris extrusa]
MFFEVVICAFIGIVAVLAILGLWRKKYSRFVPDNKHSVFHVLVDVMDSILFGALGKNALHLYIVKYFTQKSKNLDDNRYLHIGCVVCDGESSQWKERRKLLAPCFQSSMLKGYLNVFNDHAQKLVEFLHEETGKEFTCVENLLSLCSLDIVCETILGIKIRALQNEAKEYVSSLERYANSVVVLPLMLFIICMYIMLFTTTTYVIQLNPSSYFQKDFEEEAQIFLTFLMSGYCW